MMYSRMLRFGLSLVLSCAGCSRHFAFGFSVGGTTILINWSSSTTNWHWSPTLTTWLFRLDLIRYGYPRCINTLGSDISTAVSRDLVLRAQLVGAYRILIVVSCDVYFC